MVDRNAVYYYQLGRIDHAHGVEFHAKPNVDSALYLHLWERGWQERERDQVSDVGNYKCRRFHLIRHRDETGVSGTGTIAKGVQFSNGRCVLNWLTNYTSTAIYDSIEDLIAIHGHNGSTQVKWIDRYD